MIKIRNLVYLNQVHFPISPLVTVLGRSSLKVQDSFLEKPINYIIKMIKPRNLIFSLNRCTSQFLPLVSAFGQVSPTALSCQKFTP